MLKQSGEPPPQPIIDALTQFDEVELLGTAPSGWQNTWFALGWLKPERKYKSTAIGMDPDGRVFLCQDEDIKLALFNWADTVANVLELEAAVKFSSEVN